MTQTASEKAAADKKAADAKAASAKAKAAEDELDDASEAEKINPEPEPLRERQSDKGQPGKMADDASGDPDVGPLPIGTQPAKNQTDTNNPPPPPTDMPKDKKGRPTAHVTQVNSATNPELARNDPTEGEPLHKAG